MSNYTPVTNFLSKDSLVSGNPLKALKGAELSTEFAAVATAVNSKPDGSTSYFPDGSATQPSVGFTNNSGTGMYQSGGTLEFATGATLRLSIAASGAITAATLVSANGGFAAVGGAGQNAAAVAGSSASGQSFGLYVNAGTTSTDRAVLVQNQATSASFLQISGDGHGFIGPGASSGISWTALGNVSVAAPASSTALAVTGAAGGNAVTITAPNTASSSYGLYIAAGTNTSDRAALFANAAGTNLFEVDGAGNVLVPNGTGAGSLSPVYAGIPQNLQTGGYTFALTDNGKHVFNNTGGTHTFTIPANTSVAFPIGASITIVVGGGSGAVTLTTTDTLVWYPPGTTGARTLAPNSVVTILKILSTVWVVTGVGIS